MKSMKSKEDMYDAMPPFPSASKPFTTGSGGIQGTGDTTGAKVAPQKTPKMGGHKNAYGKNHPAKHKPVESVEDLRSIRKKRASDSYS